MDLSVTLNGANSSLVLKNPVIAASGCFGSGIEYAPFGALESLGGICVKGISLKARPGNPMPRLAETPAGMLNAIGLQNNGIDFFIDKTLPVLCRYTHDQTAIIANIYGESLEDFAELSAIVESEPRIAAIEVNISCPNVKAGGALFGSSPETCAQVVRACRKNASNKFIIVKLTPNVTDIAEIAKSAEKAGADAISAINTLLGMAVDAQSRKPKLANIVGGLSGPAIKPVALRCVWQIAQKVSIPVIGIGGIVNCTDIIEFMLVGASAIEVGTANFISPDTIFKMAEELPNALKTCHFESPAQAKNALITNTP